jgi:hypothetical protein
MAGVMCPLDLIRQAIRNIKTDPFLENMLVLF